MESLKDVQRLVHAHSWICTCNIQDAYLHFRARKDQQKLLQFMWNGQFYAFCTMPQGLANAPYIFTRVCKQIAKFLHLQGVYCVFYINDVVIIGDSFEQCKNNVDLVLSTLQNCGFLINWEKSQLIPQQTALVLGFIIDAPHESIALTAEKRAALIQTFSAALLSIKVPIRQFARWIGLCILILPCFLAGKMHYRGLEHEKLQVCV